MSPQDLITAGPLVLAILLAAAVLIADLVQPGKRGPILAISLVGCQIVGSGLRRDSAGRRDRADHLGIERAGKRLDTPFEFHTR